jgi:hypothetical protein
VYAEIEDPTRLHVRAHYCHDRFCRPCANARSRLISHNLLPKIDPKTVRFLTLTQYSQNEPLAELLDRIHAAFRRLRNTRRWNDHVKGGAAFIEVTYNATLDRWHVHFHLLIQGKYFSQHLIKKLWLEVTGDSYIVDIRPIRSPAECISYVTKYVTKSIDNSVWNDGERLAEAMIALTGRKQMTTFGTWRGFRLYQRPEPRDAIPVDTLDVILADARAGDYVAIAIFKLLTNTSTTQHDRQRVRDLIEARRGPPDQPKKCFQQPGLFDTGCQSEWYNV